MAAVSVHTDFGPQENKVCHSFHFCLNMAAGKWGADRGLFGNSVPLVKGSSALQASDGVAPACL